MKIKILIVSCLLFMLCHEELAAQHNSSSFNTIGCKDMRKRACSHTNDSLSKDGEIMEDSSCVSTDYENCTDSTLLRIRYLERLIELKEKDPSSKLPKKLLSKPNATRVISYYTGNRHELSIMGVKAMAEEAGLSNILFVLAQSVLETGNYTSRVCKEYNNIFGLYDSKNNDYYHFARWEDSVIGYQRYIQYRYKGGNYLSFLKRIRYAEDPGYIKKVARLARQIYYEYFKSKVSKE